ncbi:hypothetical protein GGTG_12282 [Gaeumannomyces tritici R3-111a-1]|uniref:Uncharacterized protein n=1 Tax=Gaeumannomyces tritici (strain R3-111a-1) TaxID=644352 RepID=J3PFK7_GAET3|nr:hypothetical protein GGTG_12282 [Gaeumannomyces tritici R3-111a-1]EJT70109.1 hypothetical protein GGTG_12282 [Gaeumannomyces tritici R3-111a-1]
MEVLIASCVSLSKGVATAFVNICELTQSIQDAPVDVHNLVLDVMAANDVLRWLQGSPVVVKGQHGSLVKNLEGAWSCLRSLKLLAVQHEQRMQLNKARGVVAFLWQKKDIEKQRRDLNKRVVWIERLMRTKDPHATYRVPSDPSGLPNRPKLTSLESLWRRLHLKESRQLVAAAKAGHLEQVKSSLKAGACIDYQSFSDKLEGKTALHMAVEHGHAAVVQFLLGNGASPNEHVMSPSSETALHLAVAGDHGGILRLLLDVRHVLDLNAADGGGLPALLRCWDEHLMMALLAAGADPTCKGPGSSTALHRAAGQGWAGAVRDLVAREGVKTGARDGDGYTPLEWARRAHREGRCSSRALKAVTRELAAAGADPRAGGVTRVWAWLRIKRSSAFKSPSGR